MTFLLTSRAQGVSGQEQSTQTPWHGAPEARGPMKLHRLHWLEAGPAYMWRSRVTTLLPHFTSSRRPSTVDCSHRHVGTHFLQPQCSAPLSQSKKESKRRSLE